MQTAAKAWRKLAAVRAFDEKTLEKTFRSIDLDGSGWLDHGEIRLAIKNVAPQITEMEITLMLATSDADQSGTISFDECATRDQRAPSSHTRRARCRVDAASAGRLLGAVACCAVCV